MNPQLGQRLFSTPDPLAIGLTASQTAEAMYQLSADPELEALMLEPASLAIMDAAYVEGEAVVSGLILDAVTTTFARFPRTMKALERSLNRSGLAAEEISVTGHEIGAPKKNNLFATVAVQFSLSDGQSLTVIFHAPDEDPKIFKPDDMVIAFRWLLNKRDITQVVTPEMAQGKMRDISLQSVAKRVASLIMANSEKFQAKQTEVRQMKENLGATNKEIDSLTEELQTLNVSISDLSEESESLDQVIALKTGKLTETQQLNDSLRAQIAELTNKSTSPSVDAGGDTASETDTGIAENEAGERLKVIDPGLYREITGSMSTIQAIDSGSVLGSDRALFVSSIVNKVKTRHRNEQTEVVDAVLDYITETQAKLDKPLITARNGVWKLHSNATGEKEAKDVEADNTDVGDDQSVPATVEEAKDIAGAIVYEMMQLEPNKQLTADNAREIASQFKGIAESPFASATIKHPAFVNRVNDPDTYEKFKAASELITNEMMEVALMEQVNSSGSVQKEQGNSSEKPEAVLTLENIVNGLHDDVAPDDVLEMIEEAVEQLEEKELIEQFDGLIGSATEKYAELDEKQE